MRAITLLLLAAFSLGTRGDILNLSNGDRIVATVELLNDKEVQIKSESLGQIKIPRAKVVSIFFGTNQPAATIATDTPKAGAKSLFDDKSIEKVQQDFLATATPEANAMFSDLVHGLSSGKLSIEDIRAQARDALKELRDLQADIGEDEDNPLLAGYVGILEKFVNAGPAAKNAPRKTKPAEKADDE